MSDDEDYMSDKFLLDSEQHVSSSLIHRYSDKREFALMKKKAEIDSKVKEQNKSIRVVEAEKREEGLSSAITSTNKGLYLDIICMCILYVEQINSRCYKNVIKLILMIIKTK